MKQRLRQAFGGRQKRHIVDANRTSSAVLLPVYCKEGQHYILFTKRTYKVKEHKGQISFPGGAYDGEDGTLLITALRESTEEIGLIDSDVEIIGELDDTITTTSNYIISPFVGFIPFPYHFKLNREEIEEIVEVPILALMDEDCLRQETGIAGGKEFDAYFYHYRGQVIWGATAKILDQFLGMYSKVI